MFVPFFHVWGVVLGAFGVLILSWGTVQIASPTVRRLVSTIALARRAASFVIPSSRAIGASGVPPSPSFLTVSELGDLIVRHLAESIAIDLHELVFDDL